MLLFNKPFQVLTQFTSTDGKATSATSCSAPRMRPAGRLDYDSEGLVLLTDPARCRRVSRIRAGKPARRTSCRSKAKPDDDALARLRRGVVLNDGQTLPAEAERVDEPDWLWPRDPPIRFRKAIPTSWMELTIREGRNRQVRRMTAAVGLPTLRLIRWSVGAVDAAKLAPGESRRVHAAEVERFLIARNQRATVDVNRFTSPYRRAASRASRR